MISTVSMKITKKIEICTGISTLITTVFCICFVSLYFVYMKSKFGGVTDLELIVFGSLFAIVVFLSALFVAVGAYSDAMGSDMGIHLLYVGGLAVIIILGGLGFFVLAYRGLLYGLLFYSPVILSAVTMILALSSKEEVSLHI